MCFPLCLSVCVCVQMFRQSLNVLTARLPTHPQRALCVYKSVCCPLGLCSYTLLIIDHHHGSSCSELTLSAAKCCEKTRTQNSVPAEVNAQSSTGQTQREGQTDKSFRRTSRGLTYLQTDKQMAGKWAAGQRGKESSSQTDRRTDGKLTRRQTDGRDDKWDAASQMDWDA